MEEFMNPDKVQLNRSRWNHRLFMVVFAVALFGGGILYLANVASAFAETIQREPVTISIVVVNPSEDKVKTFPVKIDLSQEVTPEGVIEYGNLSLEYDDQRSIYFLYNKEVKLEPKETRVFRVLVKDVWFISEPELSKFKKRTEVLVNKLKKSTYYESAQELAKSIYEKLDQIAVDQADEAIGQKRRIGNYRIHLQKIEKIKDELKELEKLISFEGGVPVPEMLQESQIKSDAPSTKTTWFIIIIILVFIGLVAGQFFFAWSKRVRAEREDEEKRLNNLPGTEKNKGKSDDTIKIA